MLGIMLALALQATTTTQDKPLAGSLPPMPAPSPPRGGPRLRGRLFISPMGEPFRGPDPVRQWFDGADANHDGVLTADEFVADAARFFAVLDRGHDGEIDPDDIEYYETVLAPEIRTGGAGAGTPGGGGRAGAGGGRHGGGGGGGGGRRGGYGGGRGAGGADGAGGGETASQPQRYDSVRRGAARFGFFDYPEPVVVADTNFNRGVDPGEFRAAALDRFAMLDKKHDGRIMFGELPKLAMPTPGQSGGERRGPRGRADGGARPAPDGRDPDE